MRRVTLAAPAKINLRLAVLAREETGYHSLETILCGISLADRIVVEVAGAGVELEVTGSIATGPPEHNLVRRAALRFFDELEIEPSAKITLEKVVPAAAGLGGGSSDAAATLRALNVLHGRPFDDATLLAWGASLGSDVPFFLGPTPFALAWGRGERLLRLAPPPIRHVLVVQPRVGIPTAAAFSRLAELRSAGSIGYQRPGPVVLDVDRLSTWDGLGAYAMNDFGPVAAERIEEFSWLLDRLREEGGSITLLSGSGSAIFAIFDSEDAIARAERSVGGAGFATHRASTLQRWPEPEFRD